MIFKSIDVICSLSTVNVFNETRTDRVNRNVTRTTDANNANDFRIQVANTDAIDNYIEDMWNRSKRSKQHNNAIH